MTRIRRFLIFFALAAFVPVVCQAIIQQQRAQITVTITINVTPNPLGYAAPPQGAAGTSGSAIVANLFVNRHEHMRRTINAENLSYSGPTTVALATQRSVQVEASIGPNPLGTLLYSDQSGVVINQEAGTTMTYACEYHVTVDTTQTAWTLEHGLFTDFEGPAGSWTGHDAANNTHIATPKPAYTPFIVYSDGQSWVIADTNGGMKTYCVDLQITIPITQAQGTYGSNATYTLFY
jgi:hypothetical protein